MGKPSQTFSKSVTSEPYLSSRDAQPLGDFHLPLAVEENNCRDIFWHKQPSFMNIPERRIPLEKIRMAVRRRAEVHLFRQGTQFATSCDRQGWASTRMSGKMFCLGSEVPAMQHYRCYP